MADKAPVYKIPAVVDGNGGKKFKRRGYKVKIFPVPADARVGVKAGYDGILVTVHGVLLVHITFPEALKPGLPDYPFIGASESTFNARGGNTLDKVPLAEKEEQDQRDK
jgi:hypothetical protein